MENNRDIKVRCHYCKEIVYIDDSYKSVIPDYIKQLADSICAHLSRMLNEQEELLNRQ